MSALRKMRMAMAARRAKKSLTYLYQEIDLQKTMEAQAKKVAPGALNTRSATSSQRIDFIEKELGVPIPNIKSTTVNEEEAKGNVENFIGSAQVPIGLAGPLLVKGEYAQGEFYVPMATTEGALVASYNRGMRVLYESGGCSVRILDEGMQRAPVFILPSLEEAQKFARWVDENAENLANVAGTTSG
ncbi:MAG: hypothetical protein QCI38_06970, partial [Candidatus Thermoplasmatota archaeon]|nr:hypothetical protein [Candidatus Thermoplasmatota archaeon]